MGDWWNPFDDEAGSGFNGGALSFTPIGLPFYGARKIFEAGKGLVKAAGGQSDFNAQTANVPFAPDADNPVVTQYNSDLAAWQAGGQVGPPPVAPTMDDIRAGQLQGDRARIIANAAGYDGLVKQLQDAAAGRGPSAAQDVLKEGTARNIKTQYGMAASGNVTPGQRAALMSAAVLGSADASQQGARDAAALRVQEMGAARTGLANTLTGQMGAYQPLYAGDQERELANQKGFYEAQGLNQDTEKANADQRGQTTRSVINAVAKVGGKAGGG